MTVNNRRLFKERVTEVNNALRVIGGVEDKTPKGILASSPELMQAAMPARRPMAPMQAAMPMPRPASANLPPASPIPDIAGTQAVRQAQPMVQPQAARQAQPMVQGNPMSGSLQNKPGFEYGGQVGLGNLTDKPMGDTGQGRVSLGGSPAPNNIPMSFSQLFDLGNDLYHGIGKRLDGPVDLGNLTDKPMGDTEQGGVSFGGAGSPAPGGKRLDGPEVRGNKKEKLESIRKKFEEIKKNNTKEDLIKEVKLTVPDVPEKVLAAMEVDEALKILTGAAAIGAIAGDVTNIQTGEVIRPTIGKNMGSAVERAAKARLTVEMGREQNELDLRKAESVARIQSDKGKGVKPIDDYKLFVDLYETEYAKHGDNTESALAAMKKHHPDLTERFLKYSGGQLPGTGGTETNPAINVGDTRDGFRFKGGDPSNELNWEKVS